MSEKQDWFLQCIMKIIKEAELPPDKLENFDKIISDVIEKSLPQTSNLLIKSLKSGAGEMLEEHRLIRQEFEARLLRRWSKPLNLLEMYTVISQESGEILHTDYCETAKVNNDLVFEVLTRIHGRACQITYEILCLLRSGFADGAFARWRTLHELAVISLFIYKHGIDVAERYLEYQVIENYFEMLEYQKNSKRLNLEPLSFLEYKEITDNKKHLISKFGQDFEKPFGWVASVLPKEKRNLKGLEDNVGLDHLRPYYKFACNYVHSANYGLADPGQNTSISLLQITICLLNIAPNYQTLMAMKVMQQLCDEICVAFFEVQVEIVKEEEEQQ